MLKASLLILLFITSLPAFCQDAQDELQMVQSLFGNKKDSIVGGFVKVEGVTKTKFWNLYNQFEKERKDLGQKRFSVLNNYVKSYNMLPAGELDEIIKEIISLSASQDKLIANYYKKMKKECGVAVAAQFYQIEWYLLSQVRTAVLENIPIFNDLDKRK
jgi:hypothetical protein